MLNCCDQLRVVTDARACLQIRVQLNMPVKSESKAEAADVMKTVDEDRRLVIQATIVRIMKSRKVRVAASCG